MSSDPHPALAVLPAPLAVMIAEGLPLVRALLHDLLAARPGVTIVAEVTAASQMVAEARRLAPDLVLLDWTLGGMGALQALRALNPAPAVIVLLAHAEPDYCAAILAHGGAACVAREHLHRLLPPALRQVRPGCEQGASHGRP